MLADFEGADGSLILYISKAEIFADKRRACDYLKTLRCYAADRKTSFVNAAEAIGALLSKASSPLCAEALPRICGVIQAVESRKFENFQIWQANKRGQKPVGSSRDNAIVALHELAHEFPDSFHKELSIILGKFGKTLVPERLVGSL